MANPRIFLIDMKRSAFARGGRGLLAATRLDDLSVHVLEQMLENNPNIPIDSYNEFGLGQVLHADELLNMGSAQIAQLAGLPYEMCKFELNRQCGSGMEVIHRICHAMLAGMYDTGIAMGAERMARNLHLFSGKTTKITRINAKLFKHRNAIQRNLSPDYNQYFKTPIPDYILDAPSLQMMLQTAQNVADVYDISREDCDAFTLLSHQKYQKARDHHFYTDEIVPVTIQQPCFTDEGELDLSQTGENIDFDCDEGFRANSSIATLAQLPSVKGVVSYAKKDVVLSPANCCPTNDGVAACILMTKDKADKLGVEPLAEIIGYGVAGIKPQVMGIGPVIAIQKALDYANIRLEDVDYMEFNEAFASQVIATMKELNYPLEKVNVNGGSLAIGHPLGATGVRLVGSLARQLKRANKRYGVAAQCIGSGMGIATVIENKTV